MGLAQMRETLICAAIRDRVLVEFRYNGLLRVVQPYCHGISTAGTPVLRGIQVRGESSSGSSRFGKLWDLTKMVDLRATDETFEPNDPNYNPNDTGMKSIHCRI